MALKIERARVSNVVRSVQLVYVDRYATQIYDLNRAAEDVRQFYERAITDNYRYHEYAVVYGYPPMYPYLFSSFDEFYACLMKHAYRRETLPPEYPAFILNDPTAGTTASTTARTANTVYNAWTSYGTAAI